MAKRKPAEPAPPQQSTAPAPPETIGEDQNGKAPEGGQVRRVLRVRSVSNAGRRRAGMAFGPEATPLFADELGEEQIKQLLGDPQLVVEAD